MANSPSFLQDSSPTIYTEGTLEEARRLFSGQIPILPTGELSQTGETLYIIQHHPQLKLLAHEFVSCFTLDPFDGTVKGFETPRFFLH